MTIRIGSKDNRIGRIFVSVATPVRLTACPLSVGASAVSFMATGIWLVYLFPFCSVPVMAPFGSIEALFTLLACTWARKAV